MTHSEAIFYAGHLCGTMHVSDWGVTFQPADENDGFWELRVQTWPTVEAAQSAIQQGLKRWYTNG